jgi:selenide,water dikinase
MDCSIVPLKGKQGRAHGLKVISTCDFFYPLVDDPFLQGRIGAANVLSDMYAMGVHEIDNVLMILAASNRMEQGLRDTVTRLLIEGFNACCEDAGVECTGGQTVVNPWPIIGGTAMAVCGPGDYIEPVGAVVGDVIVLTKPLGTQVVVNLNEWRQVEDKRQLLNDALEVLSVEEAAQAYRSACESMARLNRNAAKLMHKYGAHAATDVTGFGLLGHANNLAQNQLARLDIEIDALPVFAKMDAVVLHLKRFRLLQGYSPETSGGLLIAMPAEVADTFIKELMQLDQQPAWIIGKVVSARDPEKNEARLLPEFKVIQV